jgi:carboxymethylenebutenolidase
MDGTNGHNRTCESAKTAAELIPISSSVSVVKPLSRLGYGPGIVIFVPAGINLQIHEKTLDPPPLQKWAEEGYACAQVVVEDESALGQSFEDAVQGLTDLKECNPKGKLGVICMSIGCSRQLP